MAKSPPDKDVRVRRARPADVEGIYSCQAAAYPHLRPSGLCDERMLRQQLDTFPEGQLVAVIGSRVVGYAMSLIVELDDDSPWYSYSEITGNGTFSSHDPSGDTLYGADIAVHPKFRGRGIAGRLYAGRRRILKRFNLRRMVAGGRIPGYREYAGRMTAEEYVQQVERGIVKDMALNAHLKAGYRVRGVHMGYLRDDHSLDYATFLEMDNRDYRPEQRRIAASPMRRPVRKVRVCTVQYRMRRIDSFEEFEKQVEFFAVSAAQYHCHFLVFPELFTAQLFSTFPPDTEPRAAIQRLADLTGDYRELLSRFAREHGLTIVGGSHPVRRGDRIVNVAHLFTPAGNVYTQDKLHVTPTERAEYGIEPGEGLAVFETGYARIGILVCYDIEFPELARLQTLAGAEVIFVPFSTDERRAYMRVRHCAQARAVENVIYVVLAGNVGNMPQVTSFLINYGQAAICTPCDFPFPTDGVAAAAEASAETVVITDLDLSALEQAREAGTVRPLRDRRVDLYELTASQPVKWITTS